MNRFVTDILPKALLNAQDKRKTLEYDKWELAKRLDFDDQWSDHECDCDYCESNDESIKPISFTEREEIEDQLNDLNKELELLDTEIKRMTNYKKFMEKQETR